MLHFLLEIIIMTRSTKTRLLLRDKCKVVHSDRLYRPDISARNYYSPIAQVRAVCHFKSMMTCFKTIVHICR